MKFPKERLPCCRSSLDVARKLGRQTWFQCQGGFQCWTWNFLTAGLGFSLLWKIFQKTAMEVVDFSVNFCSGFLVAKCKRKIGWKNPPENRQPKTKNPPAHDPPQIRQPAQKSAAKPTNKSACQTSKYTPGFFDRAGWLLEASSEHGFWDTLWLPSGHGQGSHVEMHLQSLSCCWWDGQGLLRTLPDDTFSQKRSFSKTAQNNKKNPPSDSANSGLVALCLGEIKGTN